MSFPVPTRYNLTDDKNETVVVYNDGREERLLPIPSYISESDMIFGNLLNFNQCINNGDFSFKGDWVFNSDEYGTYMVENNVAHLNIGKLAEGTNITYFKNTVFKQIVNHIYLISLDINSETNNSIRYAYTGIATGIKTIVLNPNEWTKYTCIVKALSTTKGATLYINVNNTLSAGMIIKVKNYQIFDLTQMFGENVANCLFSAERTNEGCGVNIFNFIMPKDYYDYTPGQQKQIALIDVNG